MTTLFNRLQPAQKFRISTRDIAKLQRSKQSPRLSSVGCSVKAFKPR
ncbi:MAG: hypothetical protein F6J89_29130 [Symploca sp. SIO1C4]|uniref:Uncharacterized protein n=1 Tax=Symploca sp. SIO1C4 TaxID=2607765 RepID=A0A6B3NPY5_9CYAN|nr:hypothetical protein [Symploca sp. SIO1C4]